MATHDPYSTTPPDEPPSNLNPVFGGTSTTGAAAPLTDLEQQVLDEYTRLLDNVNRLASLLGDLADSPPTSITLDNLRLLERKTATVYTLLKASVYSIVLQQQIINDDDAADRGNNGGGHGGGFMDDVDDGGMGMEGASSVLLGGEVGGNYGSHDRG